MKVKMITFCKQQFNRILPMFDTLSEALQRAQKPVATVIYWGKDMNHEKESWIVEDINLEKVLARAASKILQNCAAGLAKVGYEDLPFDQAIAWFESRYSLHLQEDPGIALKVHNKGEELFLRTHEQPSNETKVRKLAFEIADRSAVAIVSHFLDRAHGYECLSDEAVEVVRMIEKELDGLLPG